MPAITRRTDLGLPRYHDGDESDVFLLSGAEDLVPILDTGGERVEDTTTAPGYRIHGYRPRTEGMFARIERWTSVAHPEDVHWRSLSRDNVLTVYGRDAASRITDPDDALRIFSWRISETRDDKGTAIAYAYTPEDGSGIDEGSAHERHRTAPMRDTTSYLRNIRYGNRVPLLITAGSGTGRRPRFISGFRVMASASVMATSVGSSGAVRRISFPGNAARANRARWLRVDCSDRCGCRR
ncbi:hypothetical protein GCM10017581_098840 [Dactylosporangium matsuzakiense]|uniref:Uncharacterized protein n=1 Tax=Dactylosporangium matsuzakiense TaxID=53360 RepID=A0A9W6KZ49_9ACTN|nr:hypothetical protein GCM10017581_098840 [Dactylosporangium matsuzakiense]